MSRSYANLLDLSGGDGPLFTKPIAKSSMGRSATVASLFSAADSTKELEYTESVTSEAPSSVSQERLILVANILPLHAERKADNAGWAFRWNEDALLLQMKGGLATKEGEEMDVLYVGSLPVDVDPVEQDEVAAVLLEKFNCVPTFLSTDLKSRFYHGFCKQQLWPLFHYMLPLTPGHGGRFDRNLWQAYVSVNKIFADKVMEIISPDDDYVWVHDYHLMVLPTFLRKKFNKVRLGFFLHSPFPSSEIYRTLPVREEILRALLNADLIGFHTFDYARHFLSCCSRMLGLEYESKRGHIGLEYYGRTVGIKIMPVGVHMRQLTAGLQLADTEWRVGELKAQFEGKKILLGVDDMDIFKGIGLKLLAMESMLRQHPELVGHAVLVQVANPARGRGKDIEEVREEVMTITQRVNEEFGTETYQPIVLIERHMPLYEKIAFYTLTDVCVVTAVRDGMNLIPYEYIVCREGGDPQKRSAVASTTPTTAGQGGRFMLQQIHTSDGEEKQKSMLVVSEFIGCSPSLSGAIRVNPWNIEAVADAMNLAITMPDMEQQIRHEKHYRYVSTHDVSYWAQSFVSDLLRTCREHSRLRCYGIGFGLGFRTVALDPNFRKLQGEFLVRAYRRSKSRAIFLDYDGTMMPQTSLNKMPKEETMAMLTTLCSDQRNVLFIVSGRSRSILSQWFAPCERLGLAAEHGYYFRWSAASGWETSVPEVEASWKDAALPVMESYTESTDGSSMEVKESALVWHYRDADPDFGTWQAKELVGHLESVLANEPVVVKRGHHIVEVKPQGVSKGVVVEHILGTLARTPGRAPDMVLCIGDDRSDEDMFSRIEATMAAPPQSPIAEIFACTVGQKPSKAKYYLDDTFEVIKVLHGLANATEDVARGGGSSSLSDFLGRRSNGGSGHTQPVLSGISASDSIDLSGVVEENSGMDSDLLLA
eukprot:TRINITY_DN15906_c0_g1_i1.p1 TRINITY_DN15906_c0_g1~~TRINITY_DN15906_c0_g1_i1.p1  ORF type:complete len:934 (+),score=196.90 TRINITY_DN15906_c0_g1_i1:284-3085(+)